MKILILSILTLVLIGCSADSINNKAQNEILDVKEKSTPSEEQSYTIDSESEIDELVKEWTWNEKILIPLKSSILNPEFSKDLLFKTWSDGNRNQPLFTFEMDALTIHNERKYIYTICHDSLRIFTSNDQPGDGFARGIITKLTQDSLIINWSTGDMNKYVPFSNK